MTETAFDKLSKLKVGALFMETGTGKTKIALDLIAYKMHKVDYVLWICPCSLKGEIESERIKWHPELSFDVVGCESIGSSDRIYLETLEKVRNAKSFVIVDESLKIKNVHAKRTQRIISIGDNAHYKLILNGTPVSRNIEDLWAQMEFLSPRILNMNKRDYDRRYVFYKDIKIGTTQSGSAVYKRVPSGAKNMDNLIGVINPYIFEQKLEIDSKKHYRTWEYSMSGNEATAYEELKESLFFESSGGDFKELKDIEFYSITTALQHHYCQSEERSKVLSKVLDGIDGKVVVFVKYLSSIPRGSPCITGDVCNRSEVIQRFKESDDKCLYVTYGCGAFGLNLQFCHNMVFLEHGFDYATRLQAEARIYRMGQTEDVHYHDLTCSIGLEKLFLNCLTSKKDLLQEVKKEIKKNGVKCL